MRGLASQQRRQVGCACAHAILNIFLWLVGQARKYQLLLSKVFGNFLKGPKYGSSCGLRAPKNRKSLPFALGIARRRRSVKPRNGAEPVPVQIITISACGSSGIRNVDPNGPTT